MSQAALPLPELPAEQETPLCAAQNTPENETEFEWQYHAVAAKRSVRARIRNIEIGKPTHCEHQYYALKRTARQRGR